MVKLPVIKMKSTKKNARRSNIWPFSKNSKTKTRRRRTVSTSDLGIRETSNLRFLLKQDLIVKYLSNSSSVLDLLPPVGQPKIKSKIPVLKKWIKIYYFLSALFFLSDDKLRLIELFTVSRFSEFPKNYEDENDDQKDDRDHVSVESGKVELNLLFS